MLGESARGGSRRTAASRHRRRIRLETSELVVEDEIDGVGSDDVVSSSLPLAPAARARVEPLGEAARARDAGAGSSERMLGAERDPIVRAPSVDRESSGAARLDARATLSARDGRADSHPPRDRAPERRRARASRLLPLLGARPDRLRDDRSRRAASARARARWSTSRGERGVDAASSSPELQRETSTLERRRRRRGALLGLIREFRPHILHTHTAKAGAVGRIAALLAGPAGRRPSSTPSTATCSAATSARAAREAFRQVERRLARGRPTR